MAGIRFTMNRNRLEKAVYSGMEYSGERNVRCIGESGRHYMILPLLDSGVSDCPWGRISFKTKSSKDTLFYLYLCASNEPIGTEIMYDAERSLKEKIELLAANRCLRFINKRDALMYEIEGRYLWILIEVIGDDFELSDIVVQAPGDNFMNLFPEIYREKNSFFHRYLSIFSSMYNDFQYDIDHAEELVEPDKMPIQFVEMYLKMFGVDVKGGYVNEDVMRMLLKEIAWLMANKGTRRCIERLCEMFIGETPVIVERNVMNKYLRQSETEVYNDLYGYNPYDVTLLINAKIELEKRIQLLRLLEQFKPVRCRLAVVFLENTGVLDGYSYLNHNTYVYGSSFAELDDEQLMDGTVIIQ